MIYNNVSSLSLGLSQRALDNAVHCFFSLDTVDLHSHHQDTVKFPGCTVCVVAISSSAQHVCCEIMLVPRSDTDAGQRVVRPDNICLCRCCIFLRPEDSLSTQSYLGVRHSQSGGIIHRARTGLADA
jgi:hypothetical protein